MPITPGSPCPCGSGRSYGDCCGPLHRGEKAAPSAEALMRSRFSAFALGDAAYLRRSWHTSTVPPRLELDPAVRWTRLEIVGSTDGSPFHQEGTVDFRAYYRERGATTERSMHENSQFVRENGAWVYLAAL